ncbi:uncharacterized protein LOC101672736 isoform X1 [Mustela putorius furo]|uniref:Solute carrier family 41 member n=1 Tax=Mustela putorius furo TaxID=9669 RepID=A0A8U0SLK9_MUSPF|nr:uncharacterized protein LOC101672736 isoform X1 [Mustela putorius furo]
MKGSVASSSPGTTPDAALLEDGCLPGPGNTVVIEPGQVTILLYLAEVVVQLTWHQTLDPDNHCIPYLTELGDLLGTGLLNFCFLISWLVSSEARLDASQNQHLGLPHESRQPQLLSGVFLHTSRVQNAVSSCLGPLEGWLTPASAVALCQSAKDINTLDSGGEGRLKSETLFVH